jgi:tripartite-type tricarboxylate transporter receptor subunit TctC
LSKVLKAADIEKRLSDLGSTAGTADEAELRKFLKDETAKWAEVIRASGAKEQ